MATNLMQLRRLVRSRLGIPLDDDFMPDNVLDDHLNLALQTLDAESRWPWAETATSETLTPAAPDIVLAPDWRATRGVWFRERELGLVAPGDLLAYDGLTSNVPSVWCPLGAVVAVRSLPNSSIVVKHLWYRQTAWLVRDADVPTVPGEYTGAIVAKAAELLAQRESSGSDAQRHAGEYNEWVNRMRKDMRRSTAGVHVRVRPGSWV